MLNRRAWSSWLCANSRREWKELDHADLEEAPPEGLGTCARDCLSRGRMAHRRRCLLDRGKSAYFLS
jgi:hypothetical protein